MARKGVSWARVWGGGRQVQGALPQVRGIVCAPARPWGSPEPVQNRTVSALKTAILVHITRLYVLCATRSPSFTRPPKPPTKTHMFAPTTLARDMHSLEERGGTKNPATGASRDIKCRKQGGYVRTFGSGAGPHRHPQTFSPYMRSITGVLLIPLEPAFVRRNPPNRAALRQIKAPKSTLP